MAHEIETINVNDVTDFWQQFILPRKPVIVRDLFAGQKLTEALTVESAEMLLGSMPAIVQDEYTRQMDRSGTQEKYKRAPEVTSLGKYLTDCRTGQMSRRVITEFEVPPMLLSLFSVPSFCRPSTGSHDLFQHMFVAGPGNWAHVHFDMDQRHVLLVQLFGTKTVTLFTPSSTRWLQPFGNFGSICLEAMDPGERQAFLACAGGMQGVLRPSDVIYIPPLFWHYLDYHDLAASFNIRFGRNPYSKFLSIENFIGDRYIQAVAEPFAGVAQGERPTGKLAETLDEVIAAFNQISESQLEKYKRMRRTFQRIYQKMGFEDQAPLFLFDLVQEDEREAERIMRGTPLYRPSGRASLEAIESADQPVSSPQVRTLNERLDVLGYSPEIIDKVVDNKFGRTGVTDLTRTEASRFLAYLNSPSGMLSVNDR